MVYGLAAEEARLDAFEARLSRLEAARDRAYERWESAETEAERESAVEDIERITDAMVRLA